LNRATSNHASILGCGFQKRDYTERELIDACAGKKIIKPADGYIMELSNDFTTEDQINALCSRAVYMEICITVTRSRFRRIRCPYLRELRPCMPGRSAFSIIDNSRFEDLFIPPQAIYPKHEFIIELAGNPKMSIPRIRALQRWCEHCLILSGRLGTTGGIFTVISTKISLSIPALRRCNLQPRHYSAKELVRRCSGAQIIKPYRGFPLMVSSSEIPQKEMNKLFSKAVILEICITVMDSDYKALSFPRLREIRPCLPGRPAIKIVGNIPLRHLYVPAYLRFPPDAIVFEIKENPHLSITLLGWLKRRCKRCIITLDLACNLHRHDYTSRQLIAACAGKRIIRPAEGYMLALTSAHTSERKMNALCSRAIYMEICIDITRSRYRSLRCPHLRELKSCKPGRPAIRIVDNMYFRKLRIPTRFLYPTGEPILEIGENPLLRPAVLRPLKRLCPQCRITANLGEKSQQKYCFLTNWYRNSLCRWRPYSHLLPVDA
ncbi:hypothetical protein COOONC_09297, partial [Cooperia oncophora]